MRNEELKKFITTSITHIAKTVEEKETLGYGAVYERGVWDGLTTVLNYMENMK